MTTKKITYERKAPFQINENIPEINQVTSNNLNEIKDVVNINADELESKQPKEQGKGLSTNDFTNEFKNKLENLNNYDDKEITSKVTNLEENVVNIQKEQTTQNKDIEDLKTDNKKNKTDLQAIKQEQQDQNSKIENNTAENKDNAELLNQIMGLLPSTKGEGEHVTLQDTGEARFKNFQVQGNSKQETRSGKNLFNKSGELINYQSKLAQINSGIKVTSTSTISGGWSIVKNDLKNLLGKTITIYTEVATNSNNQGYFALHFGSELNPTKEWIASSKYLNNGDKYKLTTTIPNTFPTDCNNIFILFYSNVYPSRSWKYWRLCRIF